MDKEPLVIGDFEMGRKALDALAHAHIPVTASLWLYTPQLQEWQFFVATPVIQQKGPKATYEQVWKALDSAHILSDFPMRRLFLVPSANPFISNLRKKFRSKLQHSDFRLNSTFVGDKFVEDAYVYHVG